MPDVPNTAQTEEVVNAPETGAETVATAPEAKPAPVRGPGGRFAPKASAEGEAEPDAKSGEDGGEKAEGEGEAVETDAEDKPEGEKVATTTEDDDPEPDDDDIEAWRAWRDRWRIRAAIERESGVVPPVESAETPGDGPNEPEAPKTFRERYEDLKASVEAARSPETGHDWGDGTRGYDPTPGEAKLLEFSGELVNELSEAREEVASMRQYFMVQQARHLSAEATVAAAEFEKAHGVKLTVPQLLGMAQNGGAAAWAKLNGVPEDLVALYLNRDSLLDIATSKLAPTLRKRTETPPAKKSEDKAALPSLKRGGGSNPENRELTDDEILDRAHAAHRAKQGVG